MLKRLKVIIDIYILTDLSYSFWIL